MARTLWLLLSGLCCLSAAAGSAPQQPLNQSVTTLLDQYEAGSYASVTQQLGPLAEADHGPGPLESDGRGPVFEALRKTAAPWIGAHGAGAAPRRRMVVSAVALELAAAHQNFPRNYRRALVAWACSQLRTAVPPSEAVRWWYIASVSLLESDGDWLLLGGGADYAVADEQFVPELKAGHLAHALEAFPEDPFLRLAHAEFDEHETTNHLGASWAGPDDEEIPPALLATVKDLAVQGSGPVSAKPPLSRANASAIAATAREVVDHIGRIDAVRTEYEALSGEAPLASEIELHLGYLDERLERYADAVPHLRAARTTSDPFVRGVGALLEGWAHERLGETPQALEAYRQALAMAPYARTASILLATSLSEGGDTLAAYRVLDDLWQRTTAASHPFDPWPQYARGQGRLTTTYLARMRAAFR